MVQNVNSISRFFSRKFEQPRLTLKKDVRVGQMRECEDIVCVAFLRFFQAHEMGPDAPRLFPGTQDGSRCAKAEIGELGIIHGRICPAPQSPLTKQMDPYRAPGLCGSGSGSSATPAPPPSPPPLSLFPRLPGAVPHTPGRSGSCSLPRTGRLR